MVISLVWKHWLTPAVETLTAAQKLSTYVDDLVASGLPDDHPYSQDPYLWILAEPTGRLFEVEEFDNDDYSIALDQSSRVILISESVRLTSPPVDEPVSLKGWLNEKLLDATRRGAVSEISELIARGADVDNARHQVPFAPWERPLIVAARLADVSVCDLLISKGAEVNARDRIGQTALMGAAARGRLELVKLLLDEGADATASDDDGFTAFKAAVKSGNVKTAQLLLDSGATLNVVGIRSGGPLLTTACRFKNAAMAKFLVERGADVNAIWAGCVTALGEAVWNRDPDIVRLLLQRGANADCCDTNGRTPLMDACEGNYPEGVALLLEHGADMHRKDHQGMNAFDLAACLHDENVYEILLHHASAERKKKDPDLQVPSK